MSILSTAADIWRSTPAPVKTILTAAFGTVVGAWLASRSQAKSRVVDEFKAAHAARALCFSIANRALALKRQQVRPMKERHDEAVAIFQAHQEGRLEVALDLQTLSRLKFPDDVLEKIVFEKCTVGAKALAAVVALSGATDDLKNSIDFRNGLISEFREKRNTMTELDRIQLYVGAPKAGETDSRFVSNILALSHQTDDCIFFSRLLADELTSYGNALLYRNRLRFRLGVSRLLPVDWTIAQEARLIPDDAEYANWVAGFKNSPSKWERFRTWINGLFVKTEVGATAARQTEHRKTHPFRVREDRTGYRKRSKGPHSTYLDHNKR